MTADEILSAGGGDYSHMLLPTAILLFTYAGIISERINRATSEKNRRPTPQLNKPP